MAAKTWTGEWWKAGGGGTVWDAIAYDPELDLRLHRHRQRLALERRQSAARAAATTCSSSSIVALKPDTGEYVWHYQTTPGEEWDYTATQPMILADLKIGGQAAQGADAGAEERLLLRARPRQRASCSRAKNYVPINWATGIDMKTGRPIENPAVRYGKVPVLVSPGAGGAHNWHPMAYSPQTGLVYIPVSETYMGYAAADSFDPAHPGLGTSFAGYDAERKKIIRIRRRPLARLALGAQSGDAEGSLAHARSEQTGNGGVLATAGNLVFQGNIAHAPSPPTAPTPARSSGRCRSSNVPIAAPITYMVDGEQYIAVNAGWGGGLAHVERSNYSELFIGKPRLLVFKLGGTAKLPPMPQESVEVPELRAAAEAHRDAPTWSPRASSSTARTARCATASPRAAGSRTCATCRRRPTPISSTSSSAASARRTAWRASPTCSRKDQAEAIHQYLIARANAGLG